MRWGMEEVAFQKQLRVNLNDEMSRRNLFIPRPDELKPLGDKESRIRLLQPRYEAGALIVKKGMDELKYQMINFPRTTFDDILDALAYTLQVGYKKRIKHEGLKAQFQPLYESTGY
jgi:phage terminase large subunit-like protein